MDKAVMIFPGHLKSKLYNMLGKDVVFYDAVLTEAVEIAKKLKKTGIGVIISRGGTAEAIRSTVDIPVVNCEVTNSDLLNTLLEIKQDMGDGLDKVALICYGNITYDVAQLEKICKVKVKQFWYWTDGDELYDRICEIKAEGINVVLGASMTVSYARQLGMHGFLMQVGSETIRQAVEKSKEVLEIRRNDLAQSEKVRSILSFAHEGIVSTNNQGIIDYANPRAEGIFAYKYKTLLGRAIKEIIPEWIDDREEPLLEQVTSMDNRHIIFNQVPFFVQDKKAGTVITFTESEEVIEAEAKIRSLHHKRGLLAKYEFKDIIGQSDAMLETIEKAKLFSQTDSTVLITGETGTGKELFAHGLHLASARKKKPFVVINCAVLPENLLESELFGYEEGAFSGARKGGKIGLFELAHGGTLFLDEIGEFPFALQARILRVIQEKEVMRLGGNRIIPVDVRIIVATNRNLREAVERREFRGDLYFRLNILKLNIPPLSKRLEDIPLLAEHFLSRQKSNIQMSSETKEALLKHMFNYDWPGNVRELEHFLERFVILSSMKKEIDFDEYFQGGSENSTMNLAPKEANQNTISVNISSLDAMLDEIYLRIYEANGKNKTQTAKVLGVNRMTVAKRLAEQE